MKIPLALPFLLITRVLFGQVTAYESIGITGDPADVTTSTQSGFVLAGGSTDVDEAFRWMIKRSGGGDFVVIRASGSTGYNDYIKGLDSLNSVETLLIDSREKAMKKEVGQRIREAEALFIAGGDQWNYVNYWSDSEVSAAIDFLIKEKKAPIGGTSAGCAVLSGVVFNAKHGSAISDVVLKNPYDTTVSLSRSFINVPYLENVIADQHYTQRNRHGRHVVFMARMMRDMGFDNVLGLGIDEKTALCIGEWGETWVFGKNNVYFIFASATPNICEAGQPLTWIPEVPPIGVAIFPGSPEGTRALSVNHEKMYSPSEAWVVKDGELQKQSDQSKK